MKLLAIIILPCNYSHVDTKHFSLSETALGRKIAYHKIIATNKFQQYRDRTITVKLSAEKKNR